VIWLIGAGVAIVWLVLRTNTTAAMFWHQMKGKR